MDPSSIMTAVGSFYQNERWAAAFVVAAVKGSVADYMAQRAGRSKKQAGASGKRSFRGGSGAAVAQPPQSLDLKRNLAFLLYGGVYQGMGLELIYNILFPRWFGNNITIKVLASMFVLTPFVTLPVAYLVKACVFGENLKVAIQSYFQDISEKGLLTKFWMLWIPVQTIAFALVPEHLRISFIAAVSFAWMIVFSALSSNS